MKHIFQYSINYTVWHSYNAGVFTWYSVVKTQGGEDPPIDFSILGFAKISVFQVWKVAMYGGNLLLTSSVLLGLLLGLAFQVHPSHSLLVAACLSFSSNPLATRIVNSE